MSLRSIRATRCQRAPLRTLAPPPRMRLQDKHRANKRCAAHEKIERKEANGTRNQSSPVPGLLSGMISRRNGSGRCSRLSPSMISCVRIVSPIAGHASSLPGTSRARRSLTRQVLKEIPKRCDNLWVEHFQSKNIDCVSAPTIVVVDDPVIAIPSRLLLAMMAEKPNDPSIEITPDQVTGLVVSAQARLPSFLASRSKTNPIVDLAHPKPCIKSSYPWIRGAFLH